MLSPLRFPDTVIGQDLSEVPASTDESGVKFQLAFRVGTVVGSFSEPEVASLEL